HHPRRRWTDHRRVSEGGAGHQRRPGPRGAIAAGRARALRARGACGGRGGRPAPPGGVAGAGASAAAGGGLAAIEWPSALSAARGVAVTIAPNTNQGSVAEHSFALMLGLTRNLVAQHTGTRAGQWPRRTNLPLRTRTLGLLGLGRIGKAVATRALAFEMKVVA